MEENEEGGLQISFVLLTNTQLASSDIRKSFVGYDTDQGFMVQWNELAISSKKSGRDREVPLKHCGAPSKLTALRSSNDHLSGS
jgi:hypothetical protein